jgi:hypothetical protein
MAKPPNYTVGARRSSRMLPKEADKYIYFLFMEMLLKTGK